ncbi:hypothetical protein [Gillisia sp. Hel_I_29]|uniref:hypothetical protein n=1 Tax=Gillisia sp. Hel_I_29 TaxID=1249975 RepID=UPI0005510BB7|nr:hypothetical protein [Gillisia sp. Hel_I_29]
MEIYSLYEFKLLADHDQFDLIFKEGIFLTYRLKLNSRFTLYALYRFFVEIEYDVKSNKIVNKVSLISGEKLDLYSNLQR